MKTVDQTIEHNRDAWNKQVENKIRWTIPVSPEEIAVAKGGELNVILTPKITVPKSWWPDLKNLKILGLASGGGQQGPLMAAAGADVTIYDLSDKQLERDDEVADRESLTIKTVQGPAHKMPFEDHSFDMIFNPCSICFFPEVQNVWQECARVLKPGGHLMTGFSNPVSYLFDFEKANRGEFLLKYKMPYNDQKNLSAAEQERFLHPGEPLEYAHSLTDVIGGLTEAGFVIDKFLEDVWEPQEPINEYFPPFIMLRAQLK